jgi:hypothetical protein
MTAGTDGFSCTGICMYRACHHVPSGLGPAALAAPAYHTHSPGTTNAWLLL